MQLGIAGELRCVVTKADGTVKQDTGYQKNLILNQGLDFFGGSKGSNINDYCAIGSGNSAPVFNQTALDAVVAVTAGVDTTSNYAYSDQGDNLYRIWEQKKYRFTNLDNVNVSEVGLVSTGAATTNYYLTTRALIKDSTGKATTITIKLGETLDIYYKFHKVIDLTEKSYAVDMLDGDGGKIPYNVSIKPINVGNPAFYGIADRVFVMTHSNLSNVRFYLSKADLAAVDGSPAINETLTSQLLVLRPYETGTYKRVLDIKLGLNEGNKDPIRSVSLTTGFADWTPFKFFPFQVQFGSVANDSPINKTAKDTLTIPLEFSWGRYEGDL